MKKLIVSALLALALSTSAFAADYNIRVNPLSLLSGSFNAQFDFAMGDSMTVGPTLGYAGGTYNGVSAAALALGARADFALGHARLSDGWYLAPNFLYVMASGSGASAGGFSAGVLAGYGWYWNGGFNMGVGLGAQYLSISSGLASYAGVLPGFEFNLGFAF